MKITNEETKIEGHWIYNGSKMIADEQCQRINWLIKNFLIKITTDTTGWLVLYQDPNDQRYWELTYPNSEMQGGGPPKLEVITESEVKNKYNV